jgi:hypothetical protein
MHPSYFGSFTRVGVCDSTSPMTRSVAVVGKTPSESKMLGSCDCCLNPLPHECLVDSAPPPHSRVFEIPPELVAGKPGFASPTARPEPRHQAPPPHTIRPSTLGLALPHLEWMEGVASNASAKHRHPMALSGFSPLLAVEESSFQSRPEKHFPGHHFLNPADKCCELF